MMMTMCIEGFSSLEPIYFDESADETCSSKDETEILMILVKKKLEKVLVIEIFAITQATHACLLGHMGNH